MHDVIKPKSIKQDKEVRALTIDEQKELSDYLFKSSIKDEKYKNVFLIQMYMGLRIGETLALTKNDIEDVKSLFNKDYASTFIVTSK